MYACQPFLVLLFFFTIRFLIAPLESSNSSILEYGVTLALIVNFEEQLFIQHAYYAVCCVDLYLSTTCIVLHETELLTLWFTCILT